MPNNYTIDKIIFSPKDVDLFNSPLRDGIDEETYVLGAFNPGLSRLPNGNLLIMVRIAEALKENVVGEKLRVIRKPVKSQYIIDEYNLSEFYTDDPRKYLSKKYTHCKNYALTSFSWLLPVELSADGLDVIKIHYEKAIVPTEFYQEYGIEDARITKIENKYYMTACCVSTTRHTTVLYRSDNGLDYECLGIILDHQNKDMVLFPESILGKYFALTRPLGDHYFISPDQSNVIGGPSINIAQSPDLLHWKPLDVPLIVLKKNSKISKKVGGGAPPIKTSKGWLVFFHGVESKDEVGIYNTFWAMLDLEQPEKIIINAIEKPILLANPKLTDYLEDHKYVENVVFTSGVVEDKKNFILASGELDLYCRITYIPKEKLIK